MCKKTPPPAVELMEGLAGSFGGSERVDQNSSDGKGAEGQKEEPSSRAQWERLTARAEST